jgi:hypothetical protein
MVNGDVVEVEPRSATWWRGFHLGYAWFGCLGQVGGQGWVSDVKTLISLPRSLHFTAKKLGFRRVNFSLEGKKSLIFATTELKLSHTHTHTHKHINYKVWLFNCKSNNIANPENIKKLKLKSETMSFW